MCVVYGLCVNNNEIWCSLLNVLGVCIANDVMYLERRGGTQEFAL